MAAKKFKTEVSQLLRLIIHSLYSHKEIFLRELVSNASDALDKLKYLTLTDEGFKNLAFDPRIDITFDGDKQQTLTISDSGIGMNGEELENNLGTIARSGTKNFLSQLTGDEKRDSNLIGQFGVGFYSSFMVASRVEVISKKAGEEGAYKWESDGENSFTVTGAEREGFGTTVILHLNEEGREYANRWQIQELIKKYSNHIAFPIFLEYDQSRYEGEGENRKELKEHKIEQINSASALWKRSKTDLKEEDYHEFYKSISGDSQDPLFYVHTQAEGAQEYTTLFFIPQKAPFDLFHADYRPGVKLYVHRVFITDDDKELMPVYLRFLRGVIDSEDLPLNVSREILQQNRVLAQIRAASVKKILQELKSLSENNKEKYIQFIDEFNRPLKEGLYGDYANREILMELVRFKSTFDQGYTGLADYVSRMPEDQKVIYYISGGSEDTLRSSPLLAAYQKKNWEVLIMDQEIDELVVPTLGRYKDREIKAINRASTNEDLKTGEDKKKEEELKPVLARIKEVLGDRVKDVAASSRLTDAPSCLISDDSDPSLQLQQMLKSMGADSLGGEVKPILEINPDHPIVAKLITTEDQAVFEDVSLL
ncbi:MAG: molecular chaperone HtpG, partial [Spirochaetales bacterium]|nr:molecular chaperone HtpG [Spirochaetales bacterium]